VTRQRRSAAGTRAVLLPALLLSLSAGLGACGDDDPEQEPGPTSSASPSTGATGQTTSEPTSPDPTDPSASDSNTDPSVAPATGIQLDEASSTVTAPAGWKKQPEILEYASAAAKGQSSLQLVDSGDISGGASLDSLAESTLDTLPPGAKGERLPDVELDGQPFLHVRYTVKGEPLEHHTFTTIRNERNVGLDFVLLERDAATNPALIDSVLTTFRWTA
jgi:hypothetical protein